jgi:hypothetical protein
VLTPVTGAVLVAVMVYAYVAVPGASNSLYRFFHDNLLSKQEHGVVYVQMQLGDAKV